MTSLLIGEQEESLFLLHEQPPTILQQAESLDGIKSIQQLLSTSSSLASATLPNLPQHSFRPSTSSHDVIPPPVRFSSTQPRYPSSNGIDSFVRQFERRLDEHRVLTQKDYDRKIQQMIESKNSELDTLKLRYEGKLQELEETNRHLEIQSGQIIEENKRLKIELDHEKEQHKIEQASMQQHLKGSEADGERKIHELKVLHENEKQETKRLHSRTYQDLLDETNQRLKKMENEHRYQQSTNESTVEEMEKRLVDLRSNIDHLQQLKQKLDDDKFQLIKSNEKLQLQVQDLTNKQRHLDRDHADRSQRYENELKSVRVRCQSTIDLLEKENGVVKSKSTKTIEELEKKLTTITEKFHELERFFEKQTREQQETYQKTVKQCENDYEKRIQVLQEEHREQLEKELQRQKSQMQINLDDHIQEINDHIRENEQHLIEKVKVEYEQLLQQNEELLRNNFNKELEEAKRRYEQTIGRKDEKMKSDLQDINKTSVEVTLKHENEKQQIINEYDEFIRKLERQYSQKADEYEQRIESLIAKTNEQLKTIEDEFETRSVKQQALISDLQKIVAKLEDEKNHARILHDKQNRILSEQYSRERNDMKSQSELYMKRFEKNFNLLKLKNEQLERKINHLNEQHKHELLECRLSHEMKTKEQLSRDVRLDLENTIFSLKQQVVCLQQRIAFLQKELQQYVRDHGHRASSHS